MLDLDTLDLKRLRAFHLVARQGSLRLAAARLKQSIPAVSAKIRKLESDLGFALFERLPNRLVLTPSGERVLAEVDAIFARAEEALANLSRGAPEGRLAISVGSDHAWFFAPKIRDFLNRYPSIEVNLRVYKSADALVALDKGEIDLALGIFPNLPKRLARETVVETGLSLAFHPQDFPRRRKPGLADLARQRLIVPPATTATRRMIAHTLKRTLERASMLLEAPTCATAAAFVEAGVGTAIVHTVCIDHLRSARVQAVELGARAGAVEFSVVWRKGAARTPQASELIAALTQKSRPARLSRS
jgi:DNA-binding transcriptional LysR family regulator